MKTNTKILIGLGIAAAATTAIAIGVIRELRAIRNLTIDIDDLPEDDACDAIAEGAEEAVVEEVVAEETVAEEAPVEAVAEEAAAD